MGSSWWSPADCTSLAPGAPLYQVRASCSFLLTVLYDLQCHLQITIDITLHGGGEVVGDLQSIVHHQPQEHPLHQIRAGCPLLMKVLYYLQCHLQITRCITLHGERRATNDFLLIL